MPRYLLAAGLVAVFVGLAPGAAVSASRSSLPNREQIRLNPADQAAARAAVLRRGDFGAGWTGGARKPDLSQGLSCPGYTPKQSDLVLTGAAETVFHHTGLTLQTDAQVLKTRSMVARDWTRSIVDPRAFACVRHLLARQLTSNEQLVSFRKIAFPHVARYAACFRMLITVRVRSQNVRVLIDLVLVGRSRTELTLTVSAPAAAHAAISAMEVRLARALLARVRA